jgi:hypothetical protein
LTPSNRSFSAWDNRICNGLAWPGFDAGTAGLAWPGLAWPGWPGLRAGLAWRGWLAWHSLAAWLAWPGLFQLAWPGLAQTLRLGVDMFLRRPRFGSPDRDLILIS